MLKETLRAVALGSLISCAEGAEGLRTETQSIPVSDIPLYMGEVADARACIMDKYVTLENSVNGKMLLPDALEPAFAGVRSDSGHRDTINTQMTWYLNGHATRRSLLGEDPFDEAAFFSELGAVLKAHNSEEGEGVYHANWKKYCPSAENPDDFYRSAFFVGPAYGIDGVGLCLGTEHRCGDF